VLVVLLYLNEKLGCFGALLLSTTSHHASAWTSRTQSLLGGKAQEQHAGEGNKERKN
jgi:hypothetical protein